MTCGFLQLGSCIQDTEEDFVVVFAVALEDWVVVDIFVLLLSLRIMLLFLLLRIPVGECQNCRS